MIVSYNNQAEEIRLKTLKNAEPLKYNKELCEKIKKDTENTYLPLFNEEETEHIKKHLENYHKIPDKELHYDFLNLRNMFLTIKQFETEPNIIQKINTILNYLKKFDYIFLLIIEAQNKPQKKDPILERALIILHLEINIFCMRYTKILREDNEPRFDTTPLTITEETQDYPETETETEEEETQEQLTNYEEEEP